MVMVVKQMCIRDSHRGGRTGGFDLNALIVAHGTHTANGGTGNQTVALAVSYTHLDVYKRQHHARGDDHTVPVNVETANAERNAVDGKFQPKAGKLNIKRCV